MAEWLGVRIIEKHFTQDCSLLGPNNKLPCFIFNSLKFFTTFHQGRPMKNHLLNQNFG